MKKNIMLAYLIFSAACFAQKVGPVVDDTEISDNHFDFEHAPDSRNSTDFKNRLDLDRSKDLTIDSGDLGTDLDQDIKDLIDEKMNVRTRSEIETDIEAIADAFYHTDFEFRLKKDEFVYHYGKGIHDANGPEGILYVDRAIPWHSAGKTLYIAITRQLEVEGILNRNTLVRTLDPLLASTPQSDLLTVGHCMDQTHGYSQPNLPEWDRAPRDATAGYLNARSIPTKESNSRFPGQADSFIYSGASWVLLWLAIHGATSVLPNGDIVANDGVNPHPTWGEVKIWFLTKFQFLGSLTWVWDQTFTHTRKLKLSEYEAYVTALHKHEVLTPTICEEFFEPIESEMTATNGGSIFGIDLSMRWTKGGFWDYSQNGIDGQYIPGRTPVTKLMTVGIGGQIGYLDRTHGFTWTTGYFKSKDDQDNIIRDISKPNVRGGYDLFIELEALINEWGAIE